MKIVRAENDTAQGTIQGAGTYKAGETATLTAVAKPGYKFTRWGHDSLATQETCQITITQDTTITAYFAYDPDYRYTIQVISNETDRGTVVGAGQFTKGTEIEIEAIAKPGYSFHRWACDDGEGYFGNPLRVIVKGDAKYTAFFQTDPHTNIKDINEDSFSVYVLCKTLHITAQTTTNTITLYDCQGRIIHEGKELTIPMESAGVYFVRIGAEIKKVIVP